MLLLPTSSHAPSSLTAAIIGAGPAGGMAALLLSRRGWDVTVIEQSRFPREKVCGECVSNLGMCVLERAGLRDAFLHAGAVRLTRAILHPPTGTPATIPLPRPMWGLSRAALDALLLEAARRAGATIRLPVRCESVVATGASGPTLRLRDLSSNAVEEVMLAWTFVADGKGALGCPKGRAPAPTGDFGVKAHFEQVAGPRDGIELFSTLGTYGGLAPIEAGRWNAAFSVPAAMLRDHRGDIAAIFARLTASNPPLARRMRDARQVGIWLAAPLPRFGVIKRWPPNVIPIGNAAAAIEPIGGEGMGLAMRSAELAVRALAEPAGFSSRRLRAEYNCLWLTRRAGCRAAAKVVSSSRGAAVVSRLFSQVDGLERAVLGLIGKSSFG